MLSIVKNSWAENNKELDVALKKLLDKKHCDIDYLDLFKVQIDTVVNPYIPGSPLDTSKILVYVRKYDPVLVFVVGTENGPDNDFWINDNKIYKTCVEYGSCPVCDALQRLFKNCGQNTGSLVQGLKSVCLHMLQHMELIQNTL